MKRAPSKRRGSLECGYEVQFAEPDAGRWTGAAIAGGALFFGNANAHMGSLGDPRRLAPHLLSHRGLFNMDFSEASKREALLVLQKVASRSWRHGGSGWGWNFYLLPMCMSLQKPYRRRVSQTWVGACNSRMARGRQANAHISGVRPKSAAKVGQNSKRAPWPKWLRPRSPSGIMKPASGRGVHAVFCVSVPSRKVPPRRGPAPPPPL
jgi:hypothetical protein